jgi:hypothetical protein
MISGVLLVPLAYQLARLTLGRTTGIIAAALVAINPFLIWHAQDGRMYSLMAMLSAASIWLALCLLQDRATWKTGLAYWAITLLALLTHYFAWWVLLTENVAAVLIIGKEEGWRVRLRRWALWQAALALALVPWVLFASALLTTHTSSWIPPFTPLEILKRSLTAFSLGSTLEPVPLLGFSALMGILFVLGLFFPSKPVQPRFRASGRILVLLFAGIPLLATVLLSLLRPAFDEKYLLAVVAPYLILVAHGLHFLGTRSRPIGIAAGVLILLASGWSLYNYYFDPAYAKSPSWRELVASIGARAEEGDVIVQNYPDPSLSYYYLGDLPLRLLPAADSTPPDRTERALQKLGESYRRIWLIPGPSQAWDAEGIVERWLGRHGDLVDEREIDSLRLQLYHTPETFREAMQSVDLELGGQVRLVGYRLAPGADEPVGPAETLALTLYWQALEPVRASYTVFVHLADPGEQIWGQHDGQPVQGTYPTSHWLPGELVVDQHQIEISPETPAGAYRLLVGMYDSSSGQRLTTAGQVDATNENRIVLETLEIAGQIQ